MIAVESGRTPGSFFGRQAELDELVAGLEDASRGEGRLFLIGGEPGIGKSRLAAEVANRARAQGATVLWGKCWEAGGAPAYWPWIQCLRAYFRGHDAEVLRNQLGLGAADIAQMLPEVEVLVPDLPPLPLVDPESARFRLFDSTTTFLRNAAGDGVLLMVIDDLHAIDTASLLFLRFLAGQIGDMSILLLATYRDVELTPDHPLTSSITDLAREPTTQHLLLSGLDEGQVALLMERMTGIALSPELVSALNQQTKGNPLFVSEAIRMLAGEGRLGAVAEDADIRLSIPAAVREVIMRRLDHLSDACRQTMTLASVLGQEFASEEVSRLADLSVEELAVLSDEAAAAGLLVEAGRGLGRFRFSHDLVREVLYQEITPGNRARLHWTAGGILERLHKADVDPYLGAIAHHYFEGSSVGNPAKAVEYGRRAAEYASGQLAYEEAARLYRMALQATGVDDSIDELLRGELLLGLGEAQARSGNFPGARETFLQAFGLAKAAGNAGLVGLAALGYGGRLLWARAGDDPHMVPMLRDALVMLGGDDDSMRVRLLTRLACAMRDSADRAHSASLSKQAVDLARDLGQPSTLAYALDGRCWSTWWPENPRERLEISAELRQLAAEILDGERMVDGHLNTAGALMELGSVREAKSEVETVIRTAEVLRQPAQRWLGDAYSVVILLLEGKFGPAEALAEATLRGDQPNWVRDNVSAARFQLFLLRREQGRLAEVEGLVWASTEDFPSYPLHRPALACLLMDLGRPAEAKAVFDELARDEFAVLHRDNEWILGTSLAAEACWMLDDKAAATVLYEQLIPFSGRNAVGLAEGSIGALDRYLGLLAGLLGWPDVAVGHFEDAIAMNVGMGAWPWVAHCQHDLAGLLLSRGGPGDRDGAVSLLGEALETAEGLGMVVLEEKIRLLLGGEAETVSELAGPGIGGVFRREGEYWSVVFDGRAVRLRDAKGMRHLARLLAAPGREFHVLDLVRMEEGVSERVDSPDPELAGDGWGDAGEVLDTQAKAAYRQRLTELEEDLAEAEGWNDSERVSRVKEEIEFLTQELAGAVGLAGRDRKAASAAERARLNVTRAIRAAMGRIAENHPVLGEHLEATVNTGLYCSYNPDPRVPLTWSL
jgi:tetratricopeptide (TPR) repeat protein